VDLTFMTTGITIRRGTPADAHELSAAAERWFRDTFAPDNSPEDMDAYCASAFSTEIQQSQLLDPLIDTLLGHDADGRLIAYAQLRVEAPPHHVVEAPPIELWRFYVDRSCHGRGVAGQLMAAVEACAVARGTRTLWLGVWERNHRAQTYYRKAGFVDIGAHDFWLGQDLQRDRLMARPVPAAPGSAAQSA
jgi:GNAT superfamily N-acetyltransferase